ncbi:PsiF family protein, partial [Thauera linaloolentis]
MKKTLHALVVSLAFVVLAPADALANPQHERMKRCNAEAREQALKGDERKTFMSTCLKGKHDAGAEAPAQAPAAPLAAPVAPAAAPVPGP